MWLVLLAQVWTHYRIGKPTCEHCFAMYDSIFWTAKYERKSCLNWMNGKPWSVTMFSTWFFGIYLNFQQQKSLQNQSLPHSESKSYQINSIKSCSSKSFQQHQRHIPSPPKYSAMKKSFNIQHFLHCKSNRHGTKPMHPFSLRAFQRHQEHNLKHRDSVDLITTKQTTFLHR
jgi:hypothetical protein